MSLIRQSGKRVGNDQNEPVATVPLEFLKNGRYRVNERDINIGLLGEIVSRESLRPLAAKITGVQTHRIEPKVFNGKKDNVLISFAHPEAAIQAEYVDSMDRFCSHLAKAMEVDAVTWKQELLVKLPKLAGEPSYEKVEFGGFKASNEEELDAGLQGQTVDVVFSLGTWRKTNADDPGIFMTLKSIAYTTLKQ